MLLTGHTYGTKSHSRRSKMFFPLQCIVMQCVSTILLWCCVYHLQVLDSRSSIWSLYLSSAILRLQNTHVLLAALGFFTLTNIDEHLEASYSFVTPKLNPQFITRDTTFMPSETVYPVLYKLVYFYKLVYMLVNARYPVMSSSFIDNMSSIFCHRSLT